MEPKTFGDFLDLLQDIADEYPQTLDWPVLVESDRGDASGAVISIDLDGDNLWLIFENEEAQ